MEFTYQMIKYAVYKLCHEVWLYTSEKVTEENCSVKIVISILYYSNGKLVLG